MTIAITVYKLIIEQRILLVILLGECSLVQNFTGVLISKATQIFRAIYESTLKKSLSHTERTNSNGPMLQHGKWLLGKFSCQSTETGYTEHLNLHFLELFKTQQGPE